MNEGSELGRRIKEMGREEGFHRIAFAPGSTAPGIEKFKSWISQGHHGEMAYLSRDITRRFSPPDISPEASSVICLAVSYAPRRGSHPHGGSPPATVARYARGRDYHKVLRKRCHRLMDRIRSIAPEFVGRAFVDSGPIAERSFAAAAGLGWIGRNGCLIVPGLGSYVVLAEIVCNLRLRPGRAVPSECENCDACVRSCPTGACRGDGFIDARRCLSYLTVEERGQIGREYWDLLGSRIFGCDTCQEFCPHNRDVPGGDEELTLPGEISPKASSPLGQIGLAEILEWTQEDWDIATRGTPVRRATYQMLLRNAVIAAGCSKETQLTGPLRNVPRTHPELAELVDWAMEKLGA